MPIKANPPVPRLIDRMFSSTRSIDQLLRSHPVGDLGVDDCVIEQMMAQYADPVYQLALSILDDVEEAKDATQETFLAAANHLGSYQTGTNFRAWLFTIAVNHCRGFLRKRKVQRLLAGALKTAYWLAARPAGPEEAVMQNETRSELKAALERLDEKHRLPVILYYVHEFSTQEVADILGIRLDTVHSRLFHARRKLHNDLARQEYARRGASRKEKQP